MEIESLRTLRIDKLSDASYIVTLVGGGICNESVSCKTEGQVMELVLRDLFPFGRPDEYYDEVDIIATTVGLSVDNLIAERMKDD